MEKLGICLLLLAVAAITAQDNDKPDWNFYDNYDYYSDDYQIEDNRPVKAADKSSEVKNEQQDIGVFHDEPLETEELGISAESKKVIDEFLSKNKDEDNKESNEVSDEEVNETVETMSNEVADNDDANSEENQDDLDINSQKADPEVESEELTKDKEDNNIVVEDSDNESNAQSDEITDTKSDSPSDDIIVEKQPSDVIEEARAILREESNNNFGSDEVVNKDLEIPETLEETKKILEETNSDFEPTNNEEDSKDDTAEDTLDDIYDDINADLKKLEEIYNKLSADFVEPEKNADDSIDPAPAVDDNFDFSGEKRILEMRENADDFDNYPSANTDEDVDSDASDELPDESGPVEDNQDNKQDEDDNDDTNDKEFSNDDDTIDKVADVIADEELDADSNIFAPVDSNNNIIEENDEPESKEALKETTSNIQTSTVTERVSEETKVIDVADLTQEQYGQLMRQFTIIHDVSFPSDDLNRDLAAPIHISLSLDKPTVFTSPDYPANYPTPNIVDWVFTGDGVGIELNVTDLFVNGVQGDYLLVIPGGVDATNTDGLLFSYRLNEPRLYRFFDVDTMFVRFEARGRNALSRGFSCSAKMILPRPDFSEVVLPDPVPVVREPSQTLTLFIGGLTLPEFRSHQEEFRQILADMATMYINSNGIEPGLNSTLEVTQIIRTTPCNVQWPEYTNCAQVVFGVPLVYEEVEDQETEYRLTEADLRAMWYLYNAQDPFASRLARMGMTEFLVPDENSIMVMWVLIGFAVVVLMSLFAFALWRYSCFQNYSRMPQYSDTDSVYSKKQGLDLYPTPHQTLPPLYAENEYKWDDSKYDDAARVDMGGFSNKSYTRDMYDIESDEDIAPRDRKDGLYHSEKYEV